MDSFNFHDIKEEKANAISKYRRIQRITTLFRFVEVFVFLIVVSRFFNQFANFSLKPSGEYFRGISVTIISPRFVFLAGNVIVIVLFLKSGRFSAKNGEKGTDFYEEYVEKCRENQQKSSKEERKASDACKYSVCNEERKINRSCSDQNLERMVHGDERRRKLRRSMTERCRESVGCGRKAAAAADSSSYKEDEMSGEEFRRTVEAFIARQQRSLREEEFSAVVSLIET